MPTTWNGGSYLLLENVDQLLGNRRFVAENTLTLKGKRHVDQKLHPVGIAFRGRLENPLGKIRRRQIAKRNPHVLAERKRPFVFAGSQFSRTVAQQPRQGRMQAGKFPGIKRGLVGKNESPAASWRLAAGV